MKHEIHEGSGNVFADIGLSNPEERLAKARVALRIQQLIEQTSLTQGEAAQRMGLTQANISNILHGHLRGFSLERLFRCLNALDQDVEITIRPKPAARDRGRVSVTTAATPA